MYVGMYNDTQKSTWQMCHAYEQEFGDMQGLLAQNNFSYIFPKHWWSCLMSERVIFKPYGFKTPTVVLVLDIFYRSLKI